jgi:hypothetical protein
MNLIYQAERDEHRNAVHSLTEMQRTATEHETRASIGMCGDREDERYGNNC